MNDAPMFPYGWLLNPHFQPVEGEGGGPGISLPVSIANGGTGTDNAAQALQNLGVPAYVTGVLADYVTHTALTGTLADYVTQSELPDAIGDGVQHEIANWVPWSIEDGGTGETTAPGAMDALSGQTGGAQGYLHRDTTGAWDLGETTGAQGPQGPQGAAGAPGSNGAQGSQGPQGPQGAQGAAGTAGAQGSQGPQGPQGAASTVAGPQGPSGPPGADGADGTQGPQGPAGGAAAGVTDGSNAATGMVGEVLQWSYADTVTLASAASYSLQFTIPPGDWEVYGLFNYNAAVGVAARYPSNMPASAGTVSSLVMVVAPSYGFSGGTSAAFPLTRFNIATQTAYTYNTINLSAVTSVAYYAVITARRVR